MALTLFFLSGAFLVYVLVGYPALVVLISKWFAVPVLKERRFLSVSILLPVHNGERWIRAKLESISQLDYPKDLLEVIVIADGCTDGTEEVVRQFANPGISLLSVPRGGKAAALNVGMRHARGDILFFTDVRQSLQPDCLQYLVACFADPFVGVVSGQLVILPGRTREEADIQQYWRYEKRIRRALSDLGSALGATGCIFAMRRTLAVPMPSDTLLDDVYLPLAAFFRGYRTVVESYAKAFDYPTILSSEFRRKLRTQAGVYQLIRAYPRLLLPSHRLWIHFVSHKLGRLLLPFALIVLVASGVALDAPWNAVVATGAAIFFGLAGIDVWVAQTSPLKRLSSAARAVVVLLAAAFCALTVFVPSAHHLWTETRVRADASTTPNAPK
jgi:glycosyltransferase involved in cell wall biosynthesis